ncbi:pilus assembly protein TadG-related protein [Limnoglobus roseus]|uniref:Flp pilus-assembly TadG-like N-terminal domain-containing protein n=1 Tax=Limnoglobus roseus TaxID=2598579 RepID=A0A5C1A4L7_9BACT|nr:pilus assembly protein TadG-related protein [Limnoglobus roseus]QEL13245.1 hypothetical protein PX52LOC_00099 [Limnoglobus roseus]
MTARPLAARRGTIIPMLAVCAVALFGFLALAIDLGMLMVARSQCQNAADAAALAGARKLDNRYPTGTDPDAYDNRRADAIQNAKNVVQLNEFFSTNYSAAQVITARAGLYDYDPTTEQFAPIYPTSKPSGKSWTAVEVEVNGEQPAYFAGVLGITSLPTTARAVAAHRPRDVALVVDMSGSMQFSSSTNWEPGTAGSADVVYGLLNPDPDYPRFGHYARYAEYQITNPTKSLASGAASSRPNPLRMTSPFIGATGEVFAPNNHTIETPNGPPLIRDFYFDPINRDDPRTPATTVTAFANLWNAFQRWNPPIVADGDPNNLTPPTYSWSNYSATDTSNTRGPTPAPPSFADQSDAAGVPYVGDRFPRKGGVTSTASWNPTTSTGAARTLVDVLNTPPALPRDIPASRPAIFNGNRTEGGTDTGNFYDDGWERNGYDLDVPTYISSDRATAKTRSGTPFQGYSMGPGYWGKTFFMWPPDPRWGNPDTGTPNTGAVRPDLPSTANPAKDANGNWIADWRRRFFLRGNSADTGNAASYQLLDPQGDNDPSTVGEQNVNQTLFRTAYGHTLRDPGTNTVRAYRINYRAVLAWIRSGPQVLPPNLRAGRILYYTSIPDNVDNFATDGDHRFWRDYIDFVMGNSGNVTGFNPQYTLAGAENQPWPEGASIQIGATASYQPSPTGPANPRPYMNATDNPNRPRMHFWFGPATMLSFLSTRSPGKNWLPGTSHEAQSWQLKVGIQSALDDIKNNHPNDSVGMVFFGYPNYTTTRVTVGQDWVNLKNSLFFPLSLLPELKAGNQSTEVRPYNTGFGSALLGNLPNANGQTDPNTGLALAFNTLRKASGGGSGRKGASKLLIFETDGVPNAYQDYNLSGTGDTNRYTYGGPGANRGNGDFDVMQRAYDVATQFTQLTDAGGHSLPNAPARIYPIAFGDLFSSGSSFKDTATTFLSTLAYYGKTTANLTDPLPPTQIITGPSQTRIDNLRTTFERILQSGVQVTLVE